MSHCLNSTPPVENYPPPEERVDAGSCHDCQATDVPLPEESYYVNKAVYSRLLPSEIHQPAGKIYKG